MDCSENIDDFWNWQEESEYSFQNTSQKEPDFVNYMLDGINQHDEDSLAYILDEQTPIKNCVTEPNITVSDDKNKRSGESRECLQSKRRRMLQFESDPINSSMTITQFSDNIPQSQVVDQSLIDELLNDDMASDAGYSVLGHENLDCSTQWFDSNANQFELPFPCDDMLTSQGEIDISDFCNIPPEPEPNYIEVEVSKKAKPSARIKIKGLKSMIETPKKLITKAAYPFALIKPSCVQGDVTLKDINQKIHNPPPKPDKPKEDDEELYPTSAFSGKRVVSKTKIRTEGGRGSITIMRTKG